jgi:hypothetical protein
MTSVGLSLLQNNYSDVSTNIGHYLYYAKENPYSFFFYVLRRNTNFFSTNINIYNETIPINNLGNNLGTNLNLKDNISGDVDLLSNLYISFYLPDIYSSDKYKFKWVDNIGALLIREAVFKINSLDIDSFTGEWLCVWNELSSPVKDNFNKMAGNIPETTNPKSTDNIIRIKNNIISDFDYPSSDKNNENNPPSIPAKWVTVQLPFWFTKAPNLALPIFGLVWSNNQYNLNITFTDIEKLYTVYSDIYNMNISPSHYNILHNEKISINNFTKGNTSLININIMATCVILDSYEKNKLSERCNSGSGVEYLYESLRIKKDTFNHKIKGNIVIEVPPKFLIKELIWTLKRTDSLTNFNDALNYSYSIPFNNEKSIMSKASITWRTNTYLETMDSFYFNQIQPYQYLKTIPKQGIYLYSFSLLPDKTIHSGSYNSSTSGTSYGNNDMKIHLNFNDYQYSILDRMWEKKFGKKYNEDNSVNIENTLYITEYNFLVIIQNIFYLKFLN